MEATQQSSNQSLGFENFFSSMEDQMKKCIENCTKCAIFCEHMTQHCLKKGGEHADPDHIRLLQDCADICNTSARFMSRDSNLHFRTCEVCSEVCSACADDCDRLDDDEMMKKCAEICRDCASSCQQMAASR